MNINILRKPALITKIGRSKSSLHNDINEGVMIPPVSFGKRMVGWPEHEINAIIAARIEGQTEEKIKTLVLDLVEARKEITKFFSGKAQTSEAQLNKHVLKEL